MFRAQKNNKKLKIFDIKPSNYRAGFLVEKNNKNLENSEFSLVEALREEEQKVLAKEETLKIIQRKKVSEIENEIKSFKNVHLNQLFLNEDIPIRVVGRNDNFKAKNHYFLGKIEKKGLKEKIFQTWLNSKKEQRKLKKELAQKKQRESSFRKKIKEELRKGEKENFRARKAIVEKERLRREIERNQQLAQIKQNLLAKPGQFGGPTSFLKPALAFAGACFGIFAIVFSLRFVSYGLQIKDQVVVKGANVVADLNQVKNNFQDKNFSQIVLDFKGIEKEIGQINQDLEKMEGGLPNILTKIPFISRYNSAKKLLVAGEEIAQAMVLISQSVEEFSQIENPLNLEKKKQDYPLGTFFLNLEKKLILAEEHLLSAQSSLEEVDQKDLPEDYQERVAVLKDNFPQVLGLLEEFNQKQVIFKDLLGYNGPRKYLFLFQNNHEIRATGGFVGSYGVLSVHNGNIKELFVDGIFNPDGQLSARVVPPKPIQKISTNWSTHDANWFPNFPTSAQKIAWFYEKTGGPTVDGIITLTPTVMEKLLKITGPIAMTDYEITVDSQNFIESTQFEVEEGYDKEENRPKQFIADLTPKILDKVFSTDGFANLPQTLQIFSEALKEKHILIYSENPEIQKTVSDLGWSGEILETNRDYLMVVNSNINGYKTDGVIDQKIDHFIEIENDGSIVDTVTIERTHNGGSSEYSWWNQVNANYMRVYVPQESELLEAEGYTREIVEAPVDYDKLGFERDDLVVQLEESIQIDEKSGTEIWKENNKTVFANWVYVSPQESVKISYKYKLPFKLDLNREQGKMETYSVLYQKQSGMNTSGLKSSLKIAGNQNIFWQYPEDLVEKNGVIEYNSNLERDRFWGVVIE